MYLKSHNFGKKLDAAKCSRGDQIVLVMNCTTSTTGLCRRPGSEENQGKWKLKKIKQYFTGMT